MLCDPLDIIWRSADNPDPIFAAEDLVAVPLDSITQLAELGVLRQAATAAYVTCDACWDQHVEEVTPIKYPDDQTRFFISCPENGRVEVPRERLLQWAVDYMPILEALACSLSARGTPTEVVSGRVWNLGRAALAGKSKPLWAAKGLAWPDAMEIVASLPKGQSPVLFFLGQPADDSTLAISRESIIELRTVVNLDDGLSIDRDAIESQLADTPKHPAKKPTKKHGPRSTTIGSLKKELHEYILSMKGRIRQADDMGRIFDLPRLTQKQLANAIDATETSVSRAFSEGNDRELAIMFETANEVDMIRKYSC